MPRPQRRAPPQRAQMSPEDAYDLFSNCSICPRWGAGGMAESPEAAALWREWRAEILAFHISVLPGTRPAAWWTFDAPAEERRWDAAVEEEESQYDYLARLHLLRRGEAQKAATAPAWDDFGEPRLSREAVYGWHQMVVEGR